MPSAGVRPDVYSFTAAIAACSRAGQSERAISIFKAMCGSHVAANAISFNVVLAACQRAQQLELLLALYAAMPVHGVQPDSWACSAAVSALRYALPRARRLVLKGRERALKLWRARV